MLIVNLGTPDAADAPAVRRYLKEFLSDPRVIEDQGAGLAAPAQRHHPADAAAAQGARLRQDLEQRARRIAAQDHHARAGGEARLHARAGRRAHHGRLGDALRQSVDRVAARRADRRTAASASWSCRSIRNIRPPPPRRSATRCSACSCSCAGSRRCASPPPYYDDPVYIEALAASTRTPSSTSSLRAGGHPRVVPRHAAGLYRQGRSLLRPVRRDDAAAARAARARREAS